MVGLNFAVGFLREDGRAGRRHADRVMVAPDRLPGRALGEDRVGFGSDFDGATMPARSRT